MWNYNFKKHQKKKSYKFKWKNKWNILTVYIENYNAGGSFETEDQISQLKNFILTTLHFNKVWYGDSNNMHHSPKIMWTIYKY